jgi:hypothetical protein
MDRSRGLRNAWITIHSSGANEPIGICKVFHCGLGPLGDLCRCKKALAKTWTGVFGAVMQVLFVGYPIRG